MPACYKAKTRNLFVCLSLDSHIQWTTPVVMMTVPFLITNIRECLQHMHVQQNCSHYCLIQMTNGRAHARCIGILFGHNGTDRTHGRKQEVKSSEPNDDAGKRKTWALSQNHLSCLCRSGLSAVIAMQDHTHLLRCSPACRM